MRNQDLLRPPRITEKSSIQREVQNVVTFAVDPNANSIQIKQAVETQFKVKVADVRIARVHGKVRRQGRFAGRRPDWKKAFVRLAEGEKPIEFFENA